MVYTCSGGGVMTSIKTVTAESFNKKPLQVYREADKSGSVQITHSHYPGVVFVLTVKEVR